MRSMNRNGWPTPRTCTPVRSSDYMLRAMREDDRRAIYRFFRSLGPAGEPTPAALPPGEAPPPPYFQIVLPPA